MLPGERSVIKSSFTYVNIYHQHFYTATPAANIYKDAEANAGFSAGTLDGDVCAASHQLFCLLGQLLRIASADQDSVVSSQGLGQLESILSQV